MLGDLFLEDKLQAKIAERKKMANQERVLRVTLSRLKKNGLIINNEESLWKLTIEGVKKLRDYHWRKHSHPAQIPKSKRKMIIAFDIPKNKERARHWLRTELVGLGFKLMQKSVWLGPAPLPKEFIDQTKTLDILPHLKFFEVKETDII